MSVTARRFIAAAIVAVVLIFMAVAVLARSGTPSTPAAGSHLGFSAAASTNPVPTGRFSPLGHRWS
jgi:hypothetical protein